MKKKSKWVQSIKMKKGALHSDLKVPADKKIPAGKIESATKSDNPKTAARARFAIILAKMRARRKARGK